MHRRRAARGQGVGFVEQQHGALLSSTAKHRRDVLRRLSGPERLELRVAYEQQSSAERVGDCFRADRFTGAGRAGEVERQCKTGRVTFAEPPAIENEVVLRHLRQRGVERAPRPWRQNDVLEAPPRGDRLDRTASARTEQR
jgi:hypothetical protein